MKPCLTEINVSYRKSKLRWASELLDPVDHCCHTTDQIKVEERHDESVWRLAFPRKSQQELFHQCLKSGWHCSQYRPNQSVLTLQVLHSRRPAPLLIPPRGRPPAWLSSGLQPPLWMFFPIFVLPWRCRVMASLCSYIGFTDTRLCGIQLKAYIIAMC